MDGYPRDLAPKFNEGGGVETPFDEWWPRVKGRFPNVPENVAQYWLHEHWGKSPYRDLKSSAYRFDLTVWPSERLFEIRSTWDNFDVNCQGCVAKGKDLATNKTFGYLYKTAEYMLENKAFPAPIIVLDNRDGHANAENPKHWPVPSSYVLIEGHSRFNIGTYLQKTGRLNPTVSIWLMTRV
jgi:hypothetical protein